MYLCVLKSISVIEIGTRVPSCAGEFDSVFITVCSYEYSMIQIMNYTYICINTYKSLFSMLLI